MRIVAAGLLPSLVYPLGEGAAHSPRCSRRQPCRAYPGGFNPDQHGSTFQAEPLAAALNTGYCLLPNRGIGIAIPRAVQVTAMWQTRRFSSYPSRTWPTARPLWLTASFRAGAISAKMSPKGSYIKCGSQPNPFDPRPS